MAVQISFQKILVSLSKAKVRYLVAGGVAMNILGMERATYDLDLIVFLERSNILKFTGVMTKLGYRPKVPVKAGDFANEKLREQWIQEKNMVVFSFFDPKSPFEVIDVFVYHPRPFAEMYKAGKKGKIFGQKIRAASVKDMLFMKRKAGRPKDQVDIRFLEAIIRKQED
ncbi:MAG: hypothetical protein HYT76_10445 [Deltaproteobacteria bacterium]|nr:hypothetical protein [Deltaproteobacteria bacterium]